MTTHAMPAARFAPSADAALLLVAACWGASYGVAQSALAYYPVLAFLAVRFLLTAVLLAPACRGASRAQWAAALAVGLPLGGLLMAIFVCETYGVAHTPAGRAALLISLCVVFTPFAEWLLLGRRPARAVFGFAGVSLAGAALLTGGWPSERAAGGLGWGLGEWLMLAAAGLRAVMVCVTSRLTRRHAQVPTLHLTAVQAAVVGLGCLAWAAAAQDLPPLPRAPAFWGATLFLVLGCSALAFAVQNWALRLHSPSRVSLLMGTEPVWGALFATLWLGETLGSAGWLGGALIVASTLWLTGRKGRA